MIQNGGMPGWPGWETVRRIGGGGFGSVYEIQRDVLGEIEQAALKVISIPRSPDDLDEMYSDGYDHKSIADTFRRHLKNIVAEYSLMRRMNGSSNIVSCDDIRYEQHDDGIGWDIFIKMELLTPLAKVLPAEIPEETVIKVAWDMCAALELCRKYEIVHRDIKPQNILLSPNGDYKLGDFGVARTMEKTMGATQIGTYAYMAPEVYSNRPYGAAADIYSLGLVLYWMLNDRRLPFLPPPPKMATVEENETARLRRFAGEAIPRPRHGSRALQDIVLKACAFDPQQRYQSAGEMLVALNRLHVEDVLVLEPDSEDTLLLSEKTEVSLREVKEAEQVPEKREETTVGTFRESDVAETVYLFNQPKKVDVTLTLQEPSVRRPQKQPEPVHPKADKPDQVAQQYLGQKPAKKRAGLIAAIAAVIVTAALIVCYFTVHIWTAATCTEPVTCKICGKVQEETPSHQWMDATCTEPQICSVCGETRAKALGHRWYDASCLEPATCRICGKVQTEAPGHQWLDATCLSPKTCSVCSMITGELGGHQWEEATLYKPKTCAVCGETEGTSRGYSLTLCPIIETAENEEDVGIGTWEDTHGNVYTDAIKFWVVDRPNWYDTERIIFDLDKRYQTLSGTLACGENSDSGASIRILIYADDRLIYESATVYDYMQPLTFAVDVANVSQLRIDCTTDSEVFSYGVVYALLYR